MNTRWWGMISKPRGVNHMVKFYKIQYKRDFFQAIENYRVEIYNRKIL